LSITADYSTKGDLAADLLLEEAEGLRCSFGATHVELRHVGEILKGIPTRLHKVTMILDLAPDIDAQWRMFNAKLRKQLRKAEKSGLRFEIGHLELLDRFYEVFARNMRYLGTPVYARKAFPDSTRIFAVYPPDKNHCYGESTPRLGRH